MDFMKGQSWADNLFNKLEHMCKEANDFMSKDEIKANEDDAQSSTLRNRPEMESVSGDDQEPETQLVSGEHGSVPSQDISATTIYEPLNYLDEMKDHVQSFSMRIGRLYSHVVQDHVLNPEVSDTRIRSIDACVNQNEQDHQVKPFCEDPCHLDKEIVMDLNENSDPCDSGFTCLVENELTLPEHTNSDAGNFPLSHETLICEDTLASHGAGDQHGGVCDETSTSTQCEDSESEFMKTKSTDCEAYEDPVKTLGVDFCTIYSNMETIELTPAMNNDAALVHNFVHSSSHRRNSFSYYKDLIKGRLTSRNRLSKEYEVLHIDHADIDKESTQSFEQTSVNSMRMLVALDLSATEWEVL